MINAPDDKESDLISLKIVLLGDSGVGKTTCLTRWMTGKFYSNLRQTVGANHQRKVVELKDGSVDMFIWDTAGQEVFRSLTPMYARNSSAVIIVASIDDKASFNHIKEWIQVANNSIDPETPLILAVNKIDLGEENPYKTDQIEKDFRGMFNGIFYVSAMTGENIDSLFLQAANVGYEFFLTKKDNPADSVTAVVHTEEKPKKQQCC